MKYKLKKDLPFAKAGAEVEIGGQPLKLVWVMRVTKRKPDDLIYIGTKNELIEGGWIEEVKPREFWISKNQFFVLIDKPREAEKYIKVREVI